MMRWVRRLRHRNLGVPEEKAASGPGRKFVGSGGGGVRRASTNKDANVRIGRGGAKQDEGRSEMTSPVLEGRRFRR